MLRQAKITLKKRKTAKEQAKNRITLDPSYTAIISEVGSRGKKTDSIYCGRMHGNHGDIKPFSDWIS